MSFQTNLPLGKFVAVREADAFKRIFISGLIPILQPVSNSPFYSQVAETFKFLIFLVSAVVFQLKNLEMASFISKNGPGFRLLVSSEQWIRKSIGRKDNPIVFYGETAVSFARIA